MINIDIENEEYRDLALLQQIEADPDVSQAELADSLGVAIGTVNWHIKRLVEKGFIKVKRANRRKLRYIITPEGISLRARLTISYIQQSFRLFRKVRQRVLALLVGLHEQGIHAVRLQGSGDIAEVCRLTCMEQHFTLTEDAGVPALVVENLDIRLEFDANFK